MVSIDKTLIEVESDDEVVQLKYGRSGTYADASDTLTITETDCGTTITVYVVVAAKA